MDLNKIDELLKTQVTTPQLDSLPNTIVSIERPDEPKAEISRLMRSIVTDLHASYLMKGYYPDLKYFKDKYEELSGLAPVGQKELWELVQRTLDKRDLPPYEINVRTVKMEYDPHFIAACAALSDFTDKRPVGAKLKGLGISTTKWNNWLKIQRNYDYWHSIVDNLMDREVFEEGRLALAQNVARGDLASFKYFNELTDKFVASKDFDPRIIGVLMSGVLDIIMRHVEGTVASKIAEEIQQLGISSLTGNSSIKPIEANSTLVDLD